MHDHLPARPSLPKAYWTVLPTLLLGSLPSVSTWLSPVWPLAKQLRATTPEWVLAGLPVLALLGIGCYTIFLQWFDRRKYDEMQSRWNGLAETHGFEPIADLVLYGLNIQHQKVVRIARDTGSFVVSRNDDRFGFLEHTDRHFEGLSVWVREEKDSLIVHPDLLKISRG